MAKEERMVTLTVDGVQVSVPAGTMIVEAAAKAGITIPTLCNNRRLMPFGACRICVVQQKGRKNLMPACFNPVRNGMEILTRTPEVIKARRTQLQLMLISHPLECPVCDAGGECQLQDLVYEYGVADNPFPGEKADLPTDHVSPFIERNLNRCIVCGMCVRICDEVVGANEISFVNRGIKTKIGTDFERPMNCEFCGQCISVCPTGALTGKQWARRGRYEGVREVDTVCPYCGTGCNVTAHVKGTEIIRVTSKPWTPNEGWLCVKGRFGYRFVNSPERLTKPLIRRTSGEFEETTWTAALEYVATWLRQVREKHGADAIGGLSSARCTNEENYLFQKFMRAAVGTNNVDHCARL